MSIAHEHKDDQPSPSPILNEVNMLKRMGSVAERISHPGLCFTRLATDIFELPSPSPSSSSGQHYCIASKPQGHSLRTLHDFFPDAKVPRLLVRSLVHRLFFAINWLHAACNLIHTGTPTSYTQELNSVCILIARYLHPKRPSRTQRRQQSSRNRSPRIPEPKRPHHQRLRRPGLSVS